MEYRIGKYVLNIDVEATRAAYEALPDPDIESSKALNFLRYLSANERALSFFGEKGIDPRKIAQHFVSEADTEKQLLLYCGSFPVCGTTDAPIDDLEWFEGWEENGEQTDFGLVWSVLHTPGQIYLSYEARVPWLLSKPVLPTRYENRYVYPDLEDVN